MIEKILSRAVAIGCCLTVSYLIAKSLVFGQPILVGELNPLIAIPELAVYLSTSAYFVYESIHDGRQHA